VVCNYSSLNCSCTTFSDPQTGLGSFLSNSRASWCRNLQLIQRECGNYHSVKMCYFRIQLQTGNLVVNSWSLGWIRA